MLKQLATDLIVQVTPGLPRSARSARSRTPKRLDVELLHALAPGSKHKALHRAKARTSSADSAEARRLESTSALAAAAAQDDSDHTLSSSSEAQPVVEPDAAPGEGRGQPWDTKAKALGEGAFRVTLSRKGKEQCRWRVLDPAVRDAVLAELSKPAPRLLKDSDVKANGTAVMLHALAACSVQEQVRMPLIMSAQSCFVGHKGSVYRGTISELSKVQQLAQHIAAARSAHDADNAMLAILGAEHMTQLSPAQFAEQAPRAKRGRPKGSATAASPAPASAGRKRGRPPSAGRRASAPAKTATPAKSAAATPRRAPTAAVSQLAPPTVLNLADGMPAADPLLAGSLQV